MTALSEFLEERLRSADLSIRGFADRCDIVYETARRLAKGIGHPDDETLCKVAEGLPAPLEKLRELALDGAPRPFQVPPEFNLLDEQERRTVLAVGRQLLRSRGVLPGEDREPVEDPGGNVAVLRPAGSDGRRMASRAARRNPDSTE